jgi:hypothetical protein
MGVMAGLTGPMQPAWGPGRWPGPEHTEFPLEQRPAEAPFDESSTDPSASPGPPSAAEADPEEVVATPLPTWARYLLLAAAMAVLVLVGLWALHYGDNPVELHRMR